MKQKKTIIAVAVLAVLILASVLIWQGTRPETQTGDKTITVSVVTDTETTDFTIVTDAEYLRQALEQENLGEGSERRQSAAVVAFYQKWRNGGDRNRHHAHCRRGDL